MKERDAVPTGPRARHAVDQGHALGVEPSEVALEVLGAVRDVVQSLAMSREEAADSSVGTERFEQFHGADAAIATAVHPEAFEQALRSLARGGSLVCVGLPAEDHMTVPIFDIVLGGLDIRGSIVGTHHDLEEVFELHRRGLTRVLRQGEDGRWRWHWDPRILDVRKIWLDDPALADDYAERMREGMSRGADRLEAPVLLVRGGRSDVVTVEAAQALLRMIPQARYVDVADATHMVAGDRNDAFATAVLEFANPLLRAARGG